VTAVGGAAVPGVPIRRFAGYAFDLDGTVYLGDEPLPGAAETIRALREGGSRLVFVTNNPLHTDVEYADKLCRLGVPASPAQVVTSLDALVGYLGRRHRGKPVVTVAEPLVDRTLAAAGHPLADHPEDAAVVVVSFDRTFDYRKLHHAYRAVCAGAVIVATNPDPYCPTPAGGLPDCAAMLAAVEACTGRHAETVVGKPSIHMAEAVLGRLGLPASEAVMVGDRLLTDMAMADAAGMSSVLVLTGATTTADLAGSPVSPDHVIASLADLVRVPPPAPARAPIHPRASKDRT
jgi:HAD superfamily hydrolase (TIGR01450 family)